MQVATNAWLASVPAADKARSDAYFEGGYWLLLWDALWTSGVMLLLLVTRASARMRTLAERLTRFHFLQVVLYWILFASIAAALTFPLTVYEGFVREHQYGLSNQNFASWFAEQATGFLFVLLPMGALGLPGLLWAVRRFPNTWHLWGTALATLFTAVVVVLGPVYIAPLFNTYTSLAASPLKSQILSLARANGVPVSDVYEMDASKQSKRVSANVSGFAGTQRITLNDNLLRRVPPQGVLSVMGHEMGHYVLHHIDNAMLFSFIVIAGLFAILRWSLNASLRHWGASWAVIDVSDPAVLPLAVLIITALTFLLTPLFNTYTRTQEYEADLYGLNAARQPDAEAQVDLLLGEYRKLDPGPWEEFVFYDHPSGRTRIEAAMRWKAENLSELRAAPTSLNLPSEKSRP